MVEPLQLILQKCFSLLNGNQGTFPIFKPLILCNVFAKPWICMMIRN